MIRLSGGTSFIFWNSSMYPKIVSEAVRIFFFINDVKKNKKWAHVVGPLCLFVNKKNTFGGMNALLVKAFFFGKKLKMAGYNKP